MLYQLNIIFTQVTTGNYRDFTQITILVLIFNIATCTLDDLCQPLSKAWDG